MKGYQAAYGDPKISKSKAKVATAAHELDHDLNPSAVTAMKDRQEGKQNSTNVETSAYKVEAEVLKEIKESRKN